MGNGASSPKREDGERKTLASDDADTGASRASTKAQADTASPKAAATDDTQSRHTEKTSKKLERTETQRLKAEGDVTGHQYVCCVEAGIVYRNSPEVTDVNEDRHRIKFNEVVQPTAAQGEWICVGEEHWLPLRKFWADPKRGSDEESESEDESDEIGTVLMKRYQADQDEIDFAKQRQARMDAQLAAMMGDEDSSAPPQVSKKPSWSLLDEAVRETVLNDALDNAATKFDKLKERAVVRLQAAERGRQERKKKKKSRSKSKSSSSSGKRSKKDKKDKRKKKSSKSSAE